MSRGRTNRRLPVIQASRGTGCRSRKKLTCERNTGDTPEGSQSGCMADFMQGARGREESRMTDTDLKLLDLNNDRADIKGRPVEQKGFGRKLSP